MNPSVNPSEKHSGSHSSIKKAVITFGLIFFGACQLLGCEKWMGEPLNCAVREPFETTPAWGCRKASRWAASCVPAAEFVNWGCLNLDASVSFCAPPAGLPPHNFNITVLMKKSGVSLDCNNQIIDHSVRVTPETVLGDTSAILASIDHSLSDIEVKNCKIKNVKWIWSGFKASL